jgi:hypothetical protein
MSDDGLAPGARVMVNMDGILSGTTKVGLGGWVHGRIIGVDGPDLSVRLNVAIGGVNEVVVSPDRIIRAKPR